MQIGQPAYSLVLGPFPSGEGELVGEIDNGSKTSIAVVVRNKGEALPESNNIRTTISRQIHDESRVLVDPPSLLHAEVVEYELGWLECAVSVVVRDINSCVTETDDVPSFVTGEVSDVARMLVDLPSLGDSEVVDSEGDGAEGTGSVVQRNVRPGVTETNDVNSPITCQVRNETGVLIDAPATRAIGEVVDDGLDGCKSSVSVVATKEDMVLAESDDIRTAISCSVTEEAEVTIEAPTSSVVAEVVECEGRGTEVSPSVVLGNEDTTVSEPDNVGSSSVPNISEITNMLFDAPSPGIVGEIPKDKFDGTSEGVVAVVEGDQDPSISKSNDVAGFVAGHIGNEADVFIDAPSSCVVTEVLDRDEGLNAEAITENDDSVDPKADDIRKTWAVGRNGSVLGDHVSGHFRWSNTLVLVRMDWTKKRS